MAGRGKLMAVLLAVITVLALGGCFKKSMSPGAGAAETTAANATEAVREEAAPLHTETKRGRDGSGG